MPTHFYIKTPSPIGELTLVSSETHLVATLWTGEASVRKHVPGTLIAGETPVLLEAASQLAAYFAGTRTSFDLPLQPHGTDFQRAVWDLLRQIPYGTTSTYGRLAQQIGNPKTSRAVGAANGRNPLGIIVPCHRVIGANGDLTGFAGGLAAKEFLLRHEGALGTFGQLEFDL